MSDEAKVAFPDNEWMTPATTNAFRNAFDAGRASRGDEVAEYDRELLDSENEIDRLERELAATTVRAAAAEAVIAEALNVRVSTRGDYAIALGNARNQVRAVLTSAAPQTVLAERDRKNRFEAWWEGAEDERLNGSPVNPYTEKEQGNGNN